MAPEGQANDISPLASTPAEQAARSTFPIVLALSFSHMLNDMIQSLIPALYPMLKDSLQLNFTQIGLITLAFQMTASILQPAVGYYTDKRPQYYSLAFGMGMTLIGLLLLSHAYTFGLVLVAAALVGTGSSIFHPESSRMARAASGGRHGLAQSVFQVGGNTGSAVGPLLAAFVVLPHGQAAIAWFSVLALIAIVLLTRVGNWYKRHLKTLVARKTTAATGAISTRSVGWIIAVLLILIFSKNFYIASLSNYFTFYLIDKFQLSVQAAQFHLFIFLASVAAGTLAGGPIGDRIGRKPVIWGSILGVLPFSLALPYADLFWTTVLSMIIGMVIASAFSAILVYAQELVPGRVGVISGAFFGFSFGMGALGAAFLGKLADMTSITYVYHVCAFLPAIGILTILLPKEPKAQPVAQAA